MKLWVMLGIELRSVSKPSGTVIVVPSSNVASRAPSNTLLPLGRRCVRKGGGVIACVVAISYSTPWLLLGEEQRLGSPWKKVRSLSLAPSGSVAMSD